MRYTPHTPQDTKQMLDVIGLKSEDELFQNISSDFRAKEFNVPSTSDEFSVDNYMQGLSGSNDVSKISFMGGGYYDHIIPSVVDAIASRSEFYTAYTPYQPEASQGTLQMLYEYQSLMSRVTSMEVSNASMYDGATALAEACLMASRITNRYKLVLDGGVDPSYIEVVKTYMKYRDIEVEVVNINEDFTTNKDELIAKCKGAAAVCLSLPNFFGTIEDLTSVVDEIKKDGTLAIFSIYPIAMGILKSPAQMGADIVCGNGQCLGNYINFSGPTFGFITTKKEYIRQLPGRIIGKTKDKDDKECFVLTMQAREQHIRRGRATSNICSNQNLLALRGTIFLSLLGKNGFKNLAHQNYSKGKYLKECLVQEGINILNGSDTFNEFVIDTKKDIDEVLNSLEGDGFYAGINLQKSHNFSNKLLISVTEKRSKEQIDSFAKALKRAINE